MRSLPLFREETRSAAPAVIASPRARVPITEHLIELKARIFCHGIRIEDALWAELTDSNHYKHKRAGLSQGRFFRLQDGTSSTAVNAPVLEPFAQRSPLHLEKDAGTYR